LSFNVSVDNAKVTAALTAALQNDDTPLGYEYKFNFKPF